MRVTAITIATMAALAAALPLKAPIADHTGTHHTTNNIDSQDPRVIPSSEAQRGPKATPLTALESTVFKDYPFWEYKDGHFVPANVAGSSNGPAHAKLAARGIDFDPNVFIPDFDNNPTGPVVHFPDDWYAEQGQDWSWRVRRDGKRLAVVKDEGVRMKVGNGDVEVKTGDVEMEVKDGDVRVEMEGGEMTIGVKDGKVSMKDGKMRVKDGKVSVAGLRMPFGKKKGKVVEFGAGKVAMNG